MRASEVRRLRRWKGWTQADLANELGTDPVTVSRWELGKSRPRPSALKRLEVLALELPPNGTLGFAEDPDQRIQRIDRALNEMAELKASVRPIA